MLGKSQWKTTYLLIAIDHFMLYFKTTTVVDVINKLLCSGIVNICTIKNNLPFLGINVSVQKSKKTLFFSASLFIEIHLVLVCSGPASIEETGYHLD